MAINDLPEFTVTATKSKVNFPYSTDATAALNQKIQEEPASISEGFNPQSFKSTQNNISSVDETSYLTILNDLHRYRASARNENDYYDFPGYTFFKILFHFNNGSDATVPGTPGTQFTRSSDEKWDAMSGLLAPSWYMWDNDYMSAFSYAQKDLPNLWQHTTAWNYFVMNDDWYRAMRLAMFIELLSNISSKTPWYFQKIGGMDSVIKRDLVNFGAEQAFSFKAEKQRIQIDCIEDSYDQRIGTLLDLYRSVVWSWETKREMLPANLRKFDMTIIQFQIPLRGTHTGNNPPSFNAKDTDQFRQAKVVYNVNNNDSTPNVKNFAVIYPNGKQDLASFKAWEFHGCEIDYNSSAANVELNNEDGAVGTKHRIEIVFDDVMEIRYNEFTNKGGVLISDIFDDMNQYSMDGDNWLQETSTSEKFPAGSLAASLYQKTRYKGPLTGIDKNLDGGPRHGRSSSNIISQLISPYKSKIQNKINKVLIGNINGLSVQRAIREIGQLTSGNVWATVNNIKNYKKNNGRNIYNETPNAEMTDTSIIGEGNYSGSSEFTRNNIYYEQQEEARANTMINS